MPKYVFVFLISPLLLAGCGDAEKVTHTPGATPTAQPTETARSTPTAVPPTNTPTPRPTATKSKPTPTEPQPDPTATGEPRAVELEGGLGPAYSVAWSSDGQTLAAAGYGQIKLWDLATQEERVITQAHTSYVWGVAWSPNGQTLASASQDGMVKLWGVETWEASAALQTGWAFCVAWSPDGSQLAVGTSRDDVQVWDVETAELSYALPTTSSIISLGWSPDGGKIAAGQWDGEILLWNAETRQRVKSIARYTRARSDANGLAWSPDGQVLATAHQDGVVRLWDPTSGELLRALEKHGGWARGVAWSPDGHILASTGADAAVRVWDVVTGEQLDNVRFGSLPVWSVTWSPDGRQLAAGNGQYESKRSNNTVIVWDVAHLHSTDSTGAAPSPTPSPEPTEEASVTSPLVLTGTIIDGSGADPIPDGVLVIQSERIVAVGPRSAVAIPPDARHIDLPGTTILPGLINAHVHNAYGSANLKTWAQAGVTTVRDVGAPYGRRYFSNRDRLNENPQHARLIAAGPLVTVPEGYPIAGNNFPSLTVTSPDDARAKIDQLIDDGAEVIKITLTLGQAPTLPLEEAKAIVETAHARGIPVTVHATTAKDLERALDAGVDDVAHVATDPVSDELIQRMVEAEVAWVPTLAILRGQGVNNLRRFLDAGGQVALGNDAGYLDGVEVGLPVNEIQHLQDVGLTPMQIIVAATRNAAQVCRVSDVLGTLEAGKLADVLVVADDPLQDLDALKDVRLVIHGGVIIREEHE